MRDGTIVQIGTAEEIIMNPADDYVSDFVAGISRLNLIRAHSMMVPIKEFEKENGPVRKDTTTAHESTTLNELIQTRVDQKGPIRILDDNQETIGIVASDELLRGVIAGTEAA